jgi:hypothetical protein
MKSDDNADLGLALERAAETSSPFSVRVDDLVHQVRARRRRRTVTAFTSVGATFAAAGALAVVLATNPGAHTSQPAALLPTATATSRSPQFTIQQRTYTCGGTIAPETTSDQSADRVQLSVRSTGPGAGGAPTAQVTVTSQHSTYTRTVWWTDAQRLLVLQNGKIVAGQDLPAAPLAATTATPRLTPHDVAATPVDPSHPYRYSVAIPVEQNCPGHSWQQIWQNPAGYQLVFVASQWQFETSPSPRHYTPGLVDPDPLIELTTRLTTK